MDNIEFLLQSLDAETDSNKGQALGEGAEYLGTSISASIDADVSKTPVDISPRDNSYLVNESAFKNDYDFAITRKQLSSKYSGSGYEIHKKLKENETNQNEFKEGKSNSWNSIRSQQVRELTVASPASREVKQDVYAEPVFGLRLINPIVSSSLIQSKMAGRHPVTVSNIPYHLRCGDKSKDWVFAGAVVFKSGLKTSQKGSQYCLWKISDLKQELKQVTLYLFGKACSELWKVSLGTVAAVLNATPFYKDEKTTNDEVTLTIKSADQVMIWGGSRDYGLCKALKKNGEKCTSFVNKNLCEYCVFHVKREYNKYAGTRANLQAPSVGLANLRNKVLGKNEVFYAGKSYSAVNVPTRSSSERKISSSQNTGLSAMAKKLRDSDLLKVEKLSSRSQPVNSSTVENLNTKCTPHKKSDSLTDEIIQSKNLSTSIENGVEISKNENCSTTSPTTKSSSAKPVLSRLHLFKQAGAKMLKSGEVTRISCAAKEKKIPCFSFVDVLADSSASGSSNVGNVKENQIKEKKTISLNKKESVIDLSVDIKKSLKSNNSSVIPCERSNFPLTAANRKKKSKSNVESLGPSKILQDFKNLTENPDNLKPGSTANVIKTPESSRVPNTNLDSIRPNAVEENKLVVKTLMQHFSSPNSASSSIHDMKKARAKQSAISLIKRQGGITKTNPNQVRPDPNKRKSIKRLTDSSDVEDAEEESFEKSVLSQRFVDLMNTASKHENLVQIAEDVERQDYFNKMEKKEQLEEKMLATYKMPCKAVVCLKCKYKWFSASDLCRAEGHIIKVIETFKRFFKCDNCTNRTVSLELVPLTSCKQCGASKWSRAGMIKEKLAKNDHTLSIRGDEIKFLDSLSHSMNINLLVPNN